MNYMSRWQLEVRTRRKWRAALRRRSQLRRAGVNGATFRILREQLRRVERVLEGR